MKAGYYGYDTAFRNLFPPIIKEAEEVRGNEKGVWLPPQARGIAAKRKNEMRDCLQDAKERVMWRPIQDAAFYLNLSYDRMIS